MTDIDQSFPWQLEFKPLAVNELGRTLTMSFQTLKRSLAVFLVVLLAAAGSSPAQNDIPKGNFGFGSDAGEEAVKITFKASYDLKPGSKEGTLKVTATLAEGWHVYSVTQQKPLRKTNIQVKSDALAEPVKPESFKPDRPPKVKRDENFGDTPLEEHEVAVTWSAPLKLKEDADPAKTKLDLTISGQVCSVSCVPFKEEVTAKFAGQKEEDDAPPALGDSTSPAIPKGNFGLGLGGGDFGDAEPQFFGKYEYVQELKKAKLSVTVLLEEPWYTYSLTQPHLDGAGPMTTTIRVTSDALADTQSLSNSEKTATLFRPDTPFKSSIDKDAWPGLEMQKHPGGATWTALVDLAEGVDPEHAKFDVAVVGQRCTDEQCVRYEGNVDIVFSGYAAAGSVVPPLAPRDSSQQGSVNSVVPSEAKVIGQQRLPFWQAAIFALIGGLILNVMPCVLPVIGLKIIAFAEQAGHSRSKVLSLNLWYCGGMLAVFLVLATLAAFFNITWGDPFKSPLFRYIMLGVVFAMGLSFLGVWEIPIPGFASSDHSQKLQQQEGVAGAFSKGVFTTILATPCSGPFLGGVFVYTVTAPWYETYAIFSCIGLGMALPYLIVGIEPSLVKWLPKPGAWMDTFKQAMGFVMLATAIYLFQTVQNPGNVLAVLIMLLGLGVACWWIGRVPNYAETQQKVIGWTGGIVMAAVIAWSGFQYFAVPQDQSAPGAPAVAVKAKNYRFDWRPFSADALAQAQAEGKTVMIDFTAEWCLTCQTNWRFAINTDATKQVVESNEIVPLLADMTDDDPVLKSKLREVGGAAIPYLAIYPANRPGEVIALPDVITQDQLTKALQEAGPSKTATAMREKSTAVAKADTN